MGPRPADRKAGFRAGALDLPPAKSPMPFLFQFETLWCLEIFYEVEEIVEPEGKFEIAQLHKLQLKLSSLSRYIRCVFWHKQGLNFNF